MTAVETGYTHGTLVLAETETEGWDWFTCWLHGAPLTYHANNGCPACAAIDVLAEAALDEPEPRPFVAVICQHCAAPLAFEGPRWCDDVCRDAFYAEREDGR